MLKKKVKGFTLIELISFLVVVAIIAIIVTPLVMSIIRKAKESANKRSIDAYGRSIELAIAEYLIDNGTFPTSIEQLNIEYSGSVVECETIQINSNSSIYLADCRVGGKSVDYEYGEEEIVAYKAYSIGDEIIYKGEKYYVINNSSEDEASVTTLKENPLTTSEIIEYGTGHINEYSSDSCLQSPGTVCDRNGYGGVAYYSKENCSYPNLSGCKSDYDSSDIKFIIDNWSSHNFAKNVLLNDTMGYKTRLITYDEIIDNFNYVLKNEGPSGMYFGPSSSTPNWIYNTQYWYWTMSTYNDSTSSVWRVTWNGTLKEEPVWAIADGYAFIRPVVTFNKRFI